MILLTGFYTDAQPARTAEFLSCIERNAAHAAISCLTVFLEECVTPADALTRFPALAHPKIRLLPHARRLTFSDLFAHANQAHAGSTVMLANSDIFFDETLELLADLDLSGQLLALSRWDERAAGEPVHFAHEHSQDAWIFRAPILGLPVHFHLGVPGCDNRLAAEASRAGLKVTNPSRSIRARHLHLSNVRRYAARDRVSGQVLGVPPITLEEAGLVRSASPEPRAAPASAAFTQVERLLRDAVGDELSEPTWREIRAAVARNTERRQAAARARLLDAPLLALTSLSPDPSQYDAQRAAVRSWRAAGLTPVSFNHPSELPLLGGYEDVAFVPIEHTAHAQFGRHYIPISEMAQYVAESHAHVLIINADITLACEPWKLKRAAFLADAGLCFLVRHNHDGDRARAQPEPYGIDGFLFHARHAALIERSFMCMGKPFWDYWLPQAFASRQLPLFRLEEPLAFHKNHPQRWSAEDWHRCGLEFDRLLRVLGADRTPSACAAMSQRLRRSFDERARLIRRTPTPIRQWVQERFRGGAPKTFLELGAHRGTDTVWLAAVPGALVHAFEPDPRNQLPALPNVRVTRAAVSDVDGRAPFILSLRGWDQEWTYSSSLKRPDKHLTRYPVTFGAAIEVETVTLDRYAREQQLGEIDFIWADIQGAEAEFIRGAAQLLSRTRYLYTEYSDEALYEGQPTLSSILAMLPDFRVLELYPDDVLLENTALSHGRGGG